MKHVVLTDGDNAGIQGATTLNETLAAAIDRRTITTEQKVRLQSYLKTNLDKMKEDPVYPKHFFVLMNRSGFDRMYDSLSDLQKGYVNTYVEIIVGGAGGAPGTPGIPAAPGGNAGANATGISDAQSNTNIHVHRGSMGDDDLRGGNSDLDNRVHRWLNPVAKVTVTVQ